MHLFPFTQTKVIFILAFISLLLVACGGKQASTPSANPVISITPNGLKSPTAQASLSLTPLPPAARPTRTPSATILSEDIPPRYPARSATPAPTLSAADQATHEAEATMQIVWRARFATEMALLPECGSPNNHYYSPDGNWVALWCVNPITEVYNLNDTSRVWSLKYNEIFGLEDEHANQFFHIIPWHWSVDGRYLYLSVDPCCMDGGCPAYDDGISLVRLDLITGEVTQTLRPGDDYTLYGFSFSEGDTYLAYWRTWIEHPILNIQNLVTGEEQHIPLGEQYSEAGDVVWSLDKSQVVFSARNMDNCENMVFYLVMLDLSDFNQRVLWEGPDVGYLPVEWTEDNHIILHILYSFDYASLDLTTLELIPYPTPTSTTNP